MTPLPALLREVASKGHAVFRSPGSPNLIAQRFMGVDRPKAAMPDLLSLVMAVPGGAWIERSWPCSTTAGLRARTRPTNPDGVAVLGPGQYPMAYQRGLHHGRTALVQTGGPVDIERDNNRDAVIDPAAGGVRDGLPTVYSGYFGINIHDDLGLGSEASDGCLVLPRWAMDQLLPLLQAEERDHGPRVSLTLIEYYAAEIW